MKHLKRLRKKAFHRSTPSDSSSSKNTETTISGSPVISQARISPSLHVPSTGDGLSSNSNLSLTTSQPSVKIDIGRESSYHELNRCIPQNQSNGDPAIQQNVCDFKNIIEPLSRGTNQPCLPPKPAIEAQSTIAEYASMDTHGNMSASNPIGHSKVNFYENASNFVMYNPIMGETIQITQTQTSNVLRDMLEYVMPGAQYDSSARDSPPRCHPGTRIQILEDVQTRIHNPDLATRMVWIYGPAGVGKSAIMQTLAEAEASRSTIFTTLFFSRPNERDDPRKAFITLAYGLAVHNLEYRRYIGERLADNPMFLAKTMEEQFQQLFVTPFLTPFARNHVNFGSQRWVVFQDGLDECNGEAEQRRIVELIRKSMLHRTVLTPFIWVIASRPEVHLQAQFKKARIDVGGFWELEVPINSSQSLRDVERYLHVQFSNIPENYPDSIPPLWPSESDFLKVSEASSGLFIFASTLIAYLLGGDPVFRLKHVISLIKTARTQTIGPQQNPFLMLDLLYSHIMSDVPEEVLATTKFLLGFYLTPLSQRELLFQWTESPLLRVSNILELGQYETYAALRKLHSVLNCPSSQEAGNLPVQFFHASFSDFLLDPSRSQTYFVDLNEEITKLWQCCTKILRHYEIHRTHVHINLSWSPHDGDVEALQEIVWQDAQDIWMRVLLEPWQETGSIKLLVDNTSLARTLRELGPTIFWKTEGRIPAVEGFLSWLYNGVSPEVGSKLLLPTVPIYNLDTDKVFKSLCVQRWCYCISKLSNPDQYHFRVVDMEPLAQFGTSEWVQVKDALCRESSVVGDLFLQKNQWTTSWVLSFEGTKQCVVIGPTTQHIQGGVSYYIFPYFDSEHVG